MTSNACWSANAMDEEANTLLIDVRASTQGFQSDIDKMRGAVDTTLTGGFSKAGDVLERGLLSAIRRGSLGFDDLKRAALQTMDEIAAQAVRAGIGSLFGGGSPTTGSGSLGSLLGSALGSLLGLPARATGGPVAPGQSYWVGERGPELFVPTSAGRVEPTASGAARDVRVSIQLAAPRGTSAPVALRRSTRQVASAVRRSLRDF
jgi:phage-related minor tail protein